MATYGAIGFFVAKYGTKEDESGKTVLSYTEGKKISKAVNISVSNNTTTATRYADNGKTDEIKEFLGSTLTATPNDANENIYELLGWTKTEYQFGDDKITTVGVGNNGEPPRMAFGFIANTIEDGKKQYLVKLYSNTQWSMPDSENFQTKGESFQFNDQTLTGTTFKDCNDNYLYQDFFDTEAEAYNYIGRLLNITQYKKTQSSSESPTKTPIQSS